MGLLQRLLPLATLIFLLSASPAKTQGLDPHLLFETYSNAALGVQQGGDLVEAKRLLDLAFVEMERAGDRVPLDRQIYQLKWMRSLYPGGSPTAIPEVRERAVAIDEALLKRLRVRDGASSEAIEATCYGLGWMTSVLRRSVSSLEYAKCHYDSLRARVGEATEKAYIAQSGYGSALAVVGRFDEAEYNLSSAVTGLRKLKLPSVEPLMFALDAYQSLLSSLGRVNEYEQYMLESLATFQSAGMQGSRQYAWKIGALANFYVEWERFEEADARIWQAYAILEKIDPNSFDMSVAAWRAAGAALRAKQHQEALKLYERALDLTKKTTGPQYVHQGTIRLAMAQVKASANDLPGAVEYAKMALKFYEDNGAKDDALAASARIFLAQMAYRAKDYKEAINQCSQAQTILERSDKSTQVTSMLITALAGRGKASLVLGDNAVARRALESALLEVRRQVDSARSLRLDTARAQARYKDVVSLYLLASPSSDAAQTFEAAQLGHLNDAALGIVRLMSLRQSSDSGLSALVRDQQDTIRQLRFVQQRQDSAATIQSSQNPALEAQLNARLEHIEQTLRTNHPAYRTITDSRPVPVKDVMALLRPRDALISYSFSDDRGFAWVVTAQKARFFKLPVGLKALASRVSTLRGGLTLLGGVPGSFDLAAAHGLYQDVLKPLEEELVNVDHVFVVPEGPLQRIPLSVLLTNEPVAGSFKQQPWLLRRFAVSVLPSVSSLVAFRQGLNTSSSWSRPFVGFGDPTLKPRNAYSEKANLVPLPNTRTELQRMARTLNAASKSVFVGGDATISRVHEENLGDVRVLAFATHAVSWADVPLLQEPALVLTPSRADDGLLKASQVSQLRLNADLVILSACDTAGSVEPAAEEGFAGLSRAFFYAGAHAVLASHWYVSSNATAALTTRMLETYNSAPALGKARALQLAAAKLLDGEVEGTFDHPVYWGPFSLLGDGGASGAVTR